MFERRHFTKKVSYLMSCFVASLRGNKGFVMGAEGFRNHIGKGREGTLDNVLIHLVGIFKDW